jgi:trehalose 6-phosphate phosphatase
LSGQTKSWRLDSAELSEFFERLQAAPESALLLDYDGTLAPFQIQREQAYPYPEVVPILERIVRGTKSRVAVISGRPVRELKHLLGSLNHLEMWGSHGLERVQSDGRYEQVKVHWRAAELLSNAREWAIECNFIRLAEIKPGGIAIHWRGMSEADAREVEASILRGWERLSQSGELKLLKFELGIELRVSRPDKGDAVAAIIEASSPLAQIAYLGDDLTDEDSFRVLNGRGLTVLVRPEYRETAAKAWLKPPVQLVRFLEQWLDEVS